MASWGKAIVTGEDVAWPSANSAENISSSSATIRHLIITSYRKFVHPVVKSIHNSGTVGYKPRLNTPSYGIFPGPLSFMLKDLFRTKPTDVLVADSEAAEHRLKKALGPIDVTALGIGAIIGAGIFATIGTAAAGDATRPGAGPGLILSFVLTAIACGFAALCYAEFAAMIPISGSAYTYAYATLGELVAWIIGWDLIIEYAVGNVAVAISWGNYFKTLVGGFGIVIPDWLSTDYRTAARIPGLFENAPHIFGIPIVFNILAFGIVALITIVLVLGIRESATINTTMVMLKLIVLGFFVAVGWSYMKPDNFHPFLPNGWVGVQSGAAIVFFAYIGFDAVSTVAEETRRPARDLPIGIIGSLMISTVIYILVALVFIGIMPFDVLRQKLATEQAEPLTMALQYANIERWGNVFVGIVAFGSVVAHTAVLLVFQLGQPRIFFSMARDGLLPQSFARVHPRFRTPHVTTILTGVLVGVCAMFTSIDEMVDLTNIGTLFAFMLVCIGIWILRKREPNRPRAFKTPWVPVIPLLGVIACAYLMLGLPWITWLRFALWLLVGMIVYFFYGFRRSRLLR
jgi:basic amino acid/polyamine antiporter, APA family